MYYVPDFTLLVDLIERTGPDGLDQLRSLKGFFLIPRTEFAFQEQYHSLV